MSGGGPPHHPHGRQAPPANTAWNHLQVPNYFPSRQPQHAHMSNEHPLLHQPTWHTPTTEPMKTIPHSHIFNLEQMLSERSYPRHNTPGVDLTLTRNGNQNGDLPTTPISLSVRDTNKINSLPASALDIQAVELTKSLSPGLKSISPGLKSISPGLKSASPGGIKPMSPGISTSPGLTERQGSPKSAKKPKRMDSILERLNQTPEKLNEQIDKLLDKPVIIVHPNFSELTAEKAADKEKSLPEKTATEKSLPEKTAPEKPTVEKLVQSVIVQATNSVHDENSNSSSILNLPTHGNIREDEVVSPYSNEDNSRDSTKSRRKRKPCKTMRVSKETERPQELEDPLAIEPTTPKQTLDPIEPNVATNADKEPEAKDSNVTNERKRSNSQSNETSPIPRKTRRKTSSESETIANIAAMVQEGLHNETPPSESQPVEEERKSVAVSVSVITRDSSKDKLTKENSPNTSATIINLDEEEEEEAEVIEQRVPLSLPASSQQSTTTTIQTPAQRKATNFVEVENKLEEMFAGIEESSTAKVDPLELDTDVKIDELISDSKDESELKFDNDVPSTSQNQDVTSTSNDLTSPGKNLQKRIRPPKRKGSKSFRSFDRISKKKKVKKGKDAQNKSPGKSSNKKGKKSLNGKQINAKIETVKDVYAYDSGSNASSVRSKGPFIQIRGPRDSPISVNIVNTPVEDDTEKKPNKSKKFHDDSEYRHKVRSKGLHCSTLSNKYDAQTKDISWICVFCKRGPHSTDPNVMGPSVFNSLVYPPGDLFGPYVITSNCPEYERRFEDPYDKQFRSKKIARIVEAAGSNVRMSGKKSKRKHSEGDRSDTDVLPVHLGITETGDKTFEIWAHEDCVVWSPGVYLVGPKIIGLEEAIWTCCNVPCGKCNFRGANVCCLKRGCTAVMHFGCAVVSNWQLDYDDYKAFCAEHKTL